MSDLIHIQLTLQLAGLGAALVSPNPLVGSVVVKDGKIVGRGYHRYDELKHAEVWALEEAGEAARGSTIYVNLEPCSHQGSGKRTPPCVKALIEAGVKRVVASMVDPNPQVNGRGFDQLRAAGIEVTIGSMEREARRLNEKYVKFVTTGVPFVHLKSACSLDGKIATRAGDTKWITGEAARCASQELRHEYDAILIGVGTVLADDPLLTDRTDRLRRRPLARIVLDSFLRTPLASQLVQTARDLPLIIFANEPVSAGERLAHSISPDDGEMIVRRQALEAKGAVVIGGEIESGRVNLKHALEELWKRQITSVIVEGGAEVAGAFVAQRLIDKVTFFIAPKIIGGRHAISGIGGQGFDRLSEAIQLRDLQVRQLGIDWEFTGYPKTLDGG